MAIDQLEMAASPEDVSRGDRLRERLRELRRPVDGSSLALFRIAVGVIMAWEGFRYLDLGRVERYYGPDINFTFTYWPFDFVQPFPAPWMDLFFAGMIVVGMLVAVGLWYRVSAIALFLITSWFFLLDKTQYLNHVYLMVLITFLLAVMPAHGAMSIDNWGRPQKVPAWSVWMVRFQVGVPYLFGGIAKLNSDWLAGHPMYDWLGSRADFPLIGPLFDNGTVVLGMAWGALALDLFMVPALLWRRSRPYAYAFAVLFHLMNARLFSIGIFPWAMILMTTIFFEPHFPRHLLRSLRDVKDPRRLPTLIGAGLGALAGVTVFEDFIVVHVVTAAVGMGVLAWHLPFWQRPLTKVERRELRPEPIEPPAHPVAWRVGAGLLALWIAVQVLVPFRHAVIPGAVSWTEDGHRFAWHMKLRDKDAELILLLHENGTRQVIPLEDHLSERQISSMSDKPDMIVQFVHWLEDEVYERDVVITAASAATLNQRDPQPFILPDVDLTQVPWPWFGRAPHVSEFINDR